jgi:hypothetical protein
MFVFGMFATAASYVLHPAAKNESAKDTGNYLMRPRLPLVACRRKFIYFGEPTRGQTASSMLTSHNFIRMCNRNDTSQDNLILNQVSLLQLLRSACRKQHTSQHFVR